MIHQQNNINKAPAVSSGLEYWCYMEKLIKTIKEIISLNGRITVVIDGCCASGKTTLANRLAEQIDAQVIHMDDFFLPVHMRTEQRLSQAGGNVHYERFCDEVANGIRSGKSFEYGIYSCSEGRIKSYHTINPQKNIIIEGSYSLHPEIPDVAEIKIFIETGLETQLERIRNRNGEEALKAFVNKWIPFENRYFEEFNIKDKCDFKLTT
ncbi:MAG: AAA family ATPase [Clostridia bacterium]|nr:AAA family ATPase [Clostridia bacterium]